MKRLLIYAKKTILLVGLLCTIPSYAKMGDDHFEDMVDIFPFTQESLNHKVLDFFYVINSYLDEPNWTNNNLKRPACICEDDIFSQISFGNHRIWFHWGLSDFQYASKSLAKSFSPLKKIVNDKISQSEERQRFWSSICAEEHLRLQTVYQKAVLAFGYDINRVFNLQKTQIWAFATVAYDIHILGDLTTAEYKLVRSEEEGRKDLYQAIRVLAGHTNMPLAEKLISYLEKEAPISSVAKGTSSCSAQQLLNALKDRKNGFVQFVLSCKGFGYNYKERFKEAMLIVKY